MTTPGPHTAALIAAVSLAVLLLVGVAISTPWRPFGKAADAAPPDRASTARPDAARDLSSDEIARALRFVHASLVPVLLARGVALVLAVGLGFSKLGSRIAEAVGGGLPWPLRVAAATVALLLLSVVAVLPFNAWDEVIDRRYGLSVQTWRLWALDQLRGLAISGIVAVGGLLALVGLARAFPRWWWLVAAVGGAAVVVVMSFLFPIIIEPLFNKFTPLPAGPLRDDLIAMGARDGIAISDVLVADASRRTTALNAYVSGFGATRRIVVYDTLLQRPADEVRLVAAHELGHAADGDVVHSTVVGALGAAVAACLLGFSMSSGSLLRRAGVDGPADPRAVALLLGLFAVFAA
ncbi:MAG: endopeptidase, partial [Frankiaceae bacterium]|nr:endopeptidase [Frankiaceae bacterium]